MKKIDNENIFTGLRPSMYAHRGDHAYYCTRHHIKIEEIYATPPADGTLLWSRQRILGKAYSSNHHLRKNQEDFLSILNVLSGSLYYRWNDDVYLVKTGDVILSHPGSDNEYITGPSGTADISNLLIAGPLLEPLLKSTGLDNVACIHYDNPNHIEKLFVRMADLMRTTTINRSGSISLLCFEIIQELALSQSEPVMDKSLSGLLEFINCNLNRKISIDELSEHAGCGRTTLNRWFQEQFDLTPHRYLVRVRMSHATELLVGSDLSIKEVSFLCGYENPLNFSTEFKKFTGLSPRQYRSSFISHVR